MMKYVYDKENSIIHLHASGILIDDDPVAYFAELNADPDFIPKAEERVYFTDLDDIQFTYSGILKIRSAFEINNHGQKLSKVVFITDSELSYGMARMIISIFGEAFPEASIKRSH